MKVAPYMGAWIEIIPAHYSTSSENVAPYMGAWIEISPCKNQQQWLLLSLPTWERGLKSKLGHGEHLTSLSLPTWERGLKSAGVLATITPMSGRSLHGSVD